MPYSLDSAKGRVAQGGVIFAFLVGVLILVPSKPVRAGEAPRIEVFVTKEFLPLTATQGATVYVIDALARIEATLSRNLSGNPKVAKALVLARFARMEAGLGEELEHAAQGLVRAMQYGIDRYPAIVFDGQAVVYGLTDLDLARRFYRASQQGRQ